MHQVIVGCYKTLVSGLTNILCYVNLRERLIEFKNFFKPLGGSHIFKSCPVGSGEIFSMDNIRVNSYAIGMREPLFAYIAIPVYSITILKCIILDLYQLIKRYIIKPVVCPVIRDFKSSFSIKREMIK